MKSRADFSVHLYPRKYSAGIMIYYYVSLRGIRSDKHSTGIKITKGQLWIRSSRTIRGNPDGTQLLRSLVSDLTSVYLSFRSSGIMPTPNEIIKKRNSAKAPTTVLLKDFLQSYYDLQAEKEGISREQSTIESYRYKIKAIFNFMEAKGHQKITLEEVSSAFTDELVYYLEVTKRYSQEHRRKIVQLLKRAMNNAVRNKLISYNPIDVRFERKAGKTPVFLSQDEFTAFSALQPVGARLRKAKTLFLWQCYTGQSYADMRAFNWNKHVHMVDGMPFISQVRKKMATTTQETAKLPLLPEAVQLWESCGNALPLMSSQQYNSALKELADMAGITKNVSSHVARRTAGRLWLNEGLSFEVVATMLGHSDIRTTQKIYAAVDFSRIQRETQILLNKKAGALTPAQISKSV